LPADLPDWRRNLLTDPQTSGGLLVACAPERAAAVLQSILAAGYPAARHIGYAEAGLPAVKVVAAGAQ
jgi:selenide,water dikinase